MTLHIVNFQAVLGAKVTVRMSPFPPFLSVCEFRRLFCSLLLRSSVEQNMDLSRMWILCVALLLVKCHVEAGIGSSVVFGLM